MIAESAARRPAVLVVFDLLQLGDEDLRALLLFARRQRSHQHLEPGDGIKTIEHIETHSEPLSARSLTAITKGPLRNIRVEHVNSEHGGHAATRLR